MRISSLDPEQLLEAAEDYIDAAGAASLLLLTT